MVYLIVQLNALSGQGLKWATHMRIRFKILVVLGRCVPPRADGQEREKRWGKPHHQEHDEHAPLRHD